MLSVAKENGVVDFGEPMEATTLGTLQIMTTITEESTTSSDAGHEGQNLSLRSNPHNQGLPKPWKQAANTKQVNQAEARGALRKVFCMLAILGTLGGVFGMLVGVLLGFFLLYVSDDELADGVKPDPLLCLVGFGASTFCIMATFVLYCWLALMRHKANRLIEELAATSGSQEELQDKLARVVIARLNTRGGEKYRKYLLRAGIGEEAVEKLLTTPPQEMQNALLTLLDGNIQARLTCMLIEEVASSFYDQCVGAFVLILVGAPGLFVMLCFAAAEAALSAQLPGTFANVIGVLSIAVLISLRLQWINTFAVSISLLDAAGAASLAMQWVTKGAPVLSVLCFLLGATSYMFFLAACCVYICYIRPGFVALFNLGMERMRINVWKEFGLERDPTHLKDRRAEMDRASGPIFCSAMRTFIPELQL